MGDLVNTFSWSITRDKLFSTCRRAYWFHYYGAWGGWERDADERTRELYLLKKLGNRFTLAGQVVHATLADVLQAHRYGREIPADEARERALASLREAFRESRDGAYRHRKAAGLFEHEYGEDLPDVAWRKMRDRVVTCVDRFYDSRIRETILATPVERWLPIETLDTFDFEGTPVYVSLDFAMRNTAGNALVIDWKTGRKGEDADRTQVVCYALFAREKWRVDPHRAIGELHYLLTGEVEVVTLDESALERGRGVMRRSIGAMRDRMEDPEANEAVMDRFEQTDDRFVCSHCNFRRVCWPEWPSLRMT